MALDLSIKLNNEEVIDYNSFVIITDSYPVLNWEFDLVDRVVVDPDTGVVSDVGHLTQASYEVKISSSVNNIGYDSFTGDIVNTGVVFGQEYFWRNSGFNISRGTTYYGQVRATDESNRISSWKTFAFKYNSLPVVSDVVISPSKPSVTDDLTLNYDYVDSDSDIESGTKIRWFKNGVYQSQFNDALIVNSFNLQNYDVWSADVYPSDGREYGNRVSSPQVIVSKTSVTVSNVSISPKNPNTDDFLKAIYISSDELEQDNVLIRWYVNGYLVPTLNNEQYVKPVVSAGDQVRFEVKHINSGLYVSSQIVAINSSDFIVSNIVVDGKIESLDVSSVSPLIQWNTFVPSGKTVNYISIRIGTFFDSNNVYSQILNYNGDSFSIPHALLHKGRDYYVSIAASDTQSFSKYTTAHFRVSGSRWEQSVSNSTGWTIEMFFIVPSQEEGENVSTNYHVIRINDGSEFAEIRIYINRIVLISASRIEYNHTATFSPSSLIIAGKDNDIKIYLNREIIINGEGVFDQSSNIKRLEIGSSISTTFRIQYKYLFYTTLGYYLPGISGQYADIQFHEYMEFNETEVVALNSYINGKYIFALNPDNVSESSSIYAIVPGNNPIKCSTVARTFSPINSINKSPNGEMTVYAHAKGVTIIKGYVINPFNHELVFVNDDGTLNEVAPDNNSWELSRNTNFTAAYFNGDGFNINTLGEI